MREPWQPQCPATTSGYQCEKEEGHEGSHAHETNADIVWGAMRIDWNEWLNRRKED